MTDVWEPDSRPKPILRETLIEPVSGLQMLVGTILGLVLSAIAFIAGAAGELPVVMILSALVFITSIVLMTGLFVVNPNEAKVLQLFGEYKGTVRKPGLRWVNPFYAKRRVSLRIRNFESERLKVNDHSGNPIEIAAVVVWRVVDTAEALFHVEDYGNFVTVQSESALRNLATSYPYDAHVDGEVALRSHTHEVADHLKAEIQDRLEQAGVEVIEARITHLAYAPEIAHAMLQRQQASAVIAARQKIVDGAVGMVEMALERLTHQRLVDLDNDQKAAMITNLLVVLCSDRGTQPVVGAGSNHSHART
jgi:hypothetical protein